jgi:uncharacterized protein HemX
MNEQVMNQMPYPSGEENKSSKGPVVGTIVILIILILGAWYFWQQKASMLKVDNAPTTQQDNSAKESAAKLSNDLDASLGADLGATTSNSIDKEFTQ